MNDYITKFQNLKNSSIEIAPKTIKKFVDDNIVSKFESNYRDYIDFVSKYHCITIGNAQIPSSSSGYVYFAFYPIEDTFEFNDPFEDEYFLIAESEEEYLGKSHSLSFYVSLSKSREKGIYCAIYEENKKLYYRLLCQSFTDFIELAIKNDGRFLCSVLNCK